MIIQSTTGYGKVTSGSTIIAKYQNIPLNQDIIVPEGTWSELSEEEYTSTVVSKYEADTLISWAMAQVFTAELIPHMAAFLDFANKVTLTAKANFLAYAAAVDLTPTATTIINKAIELGANIGE